MPAFVNMQFNIHHNVVNSNVSNHLQEMTLDEYEKVLSEKRKALESTKNEERKVVRDRDFESMQLVDRKKDVGIFIKLVMLKFQTYIDIFLIQNLIVVQLKYCRSHAYYFNFIQNSEKDKLKKKENIDKEEKARKVYKFVQDQLLGIMC